MEYSKRAGLVDRCVCYNKTFTELKIRSQAMGATSIPELQKHIEFGHSCKRCHYYVDQMLKTGETVFRIVDETTPLMPGQIKSI